MKITLNPVLDLETLRWVSNEGVTDEVPRLLFQSPSGDAKANEAAQTAFYKSMTDEAKTTFGEDQALYQDVINTQVPILARGPLQYGYSPELDNLLQGYIKSTGATATANAVNATELEARQATGGAPTAPGANEEVLAAANTLGEQSTASNLTQEKLSGFAAGRQLYGQALGAITGEQSLLDPTKYATAATGAGQGATSAINLADSERSNLLQTILGGAISGVTTAATGGLTAGLGTAVSKIGSGDFGW